MKKLLIFVIIFAGVLLSCNVLFAQTTAPSITYSQSTYVYTVGTSIGTLTPINANAPAGFVPAAIYGQVTTLAGSTTGASGFTNATGTSALFNDPEAIVNDPAGNLYVVEFNNNVVRKITPGGVVTTFAGSGANTSTDGTGTGASFFGPNAITIDPTGTILYVGDNTGIRKIVISTQVVTTLAGGGTVTGSANGTGSAAQFNNPAGFAFDAAGNLYVADRFNNEIRKVTMAGVVTTFAGSTTAGNVDATGTSARFNNPYSLVNDGAGNFIEVDRVNSTVRKINISTAAVTTIYGNGTAGYLDGSGTSTKFNNPKTVVRDGGGNLYIADNANNDIRLITPAGVVSTLTGSTSQTAGLTDGTGTAATFNGPFGETIISSGSDEGNMYVVDQNGNNIRKVSLNGYTISQPLPAGLTFDPTTGVISGTPTASIPATNYTITAHNYWGSSSFTINFTINCIANPTVNITQQVTCGGAATGSVTASSTNATGYSLDGGTNQASGTFTNIAPGIHSITATCGSCTTGATSFTINGGVYTWTGTTSTDVTVGTNWSGGVAPVLDGTASISVPNAASGKYPALTASASVYSLNITGTTAKFNLNGNTINVGCNIVNSTTGGVIDWNSINASAINWNGSSAAQTYTGNATLLTAKLGNMTVNNSAAGTVTIKGGPVDIYNILTITKGNLVVDNVNSGVLTLKSTSGQTAAVAPIISPYTITGTVKVERFITGGAGYRGYRLISSPVSGGTDSYGNKIYSLDYIVNSTYVSGNGFTATSTSKTGNPCFYLYRENMAPLYTSFLNSNNRGIRSIPSSTSFLIDIDGGPFNIPVGDGVMYFFRGGTGTVNAFVTASTPVAATVTASGTLTQGNVQVANWYTPSTTALGYTVVAGATGTPAGNSAIRGLNLIGNPYASPIDWSTFSSSNPSNAIYGPNINPIIYQLKPGTNTYGSYNATTGALLNNGSNIIASGQGFFVQANNLGTPGLKFTENAKAVSQTSPFTYLAGASTNNSPYSKYMILNMAMDSATKSEVLIGFNPGSWMKYNQIEDDRYLSGQSAPVAMWLTSSDSITLVSKWMPFPKVTHADTAFLSVRAASSGQYTINRSDLTAIPALYQIWLIDKYKKDSLDLRHNDKYVFNVDLNDAGSFGGKRFMVVTRQDPALGVHLLDFTGTKAKGGAQIAWKTENEDDYTGFTVERSTDNGITFKAIGGFSSNSMGTYSLLDKTPPDGADYYRLKIQLVDSSIVYSKVVKLMYGNLSNTKINNAINIYPNPAKTIVNLSIDPVDAGSLSKNTVYSITVISNTGYVVKTATTTSQHWQADVSTLVSGNYIIQVLNNDNKTLIGKGTFIKL
ncbi:T9SS type A sorting domain-containing protein [Mucilaginibacter xinganensis]|uniref:Ig family protein n=1 Tax=Mucilaginibacter xinganensis TaxID=1234841 RepID=A0A223NRM5_9SPHI|nr:T9SS type A sorting domain-containing protein [Mucilaginibacter xinganensis]ASU32456.1 Ig family protein [Mucilaginibacter xinganensis]